MSSFFAGALMMTFWAPASMWALALSASVKMPVDSRTMSTPRSPHGSAAGSFSARMLISWPSMMIELSPASNVAVVGAVGRVVLEQQRVHLGIDEVIDRDDLDVRGTLDERLERLTADPAEAVDADTDCHLGTSCGRCRPLVSSAHTAPVRIDPGEPAHSSKGSPGFPRVGQPAHRMQRRPPPRGGGRLSLRGDDAGVSRRS